MAGLEGFRTHYEKSRTNVAPVEDAAVFQRYRDKLPSVLIDEWRISGFAAFGDAFIWLTNPDDFAVVLPEWEIDANNLVFARTAWGDLFTWDGQIVKCLAVHEGRVDALTTDLVMFFEFSLCDEPFLDEVLRHELFRQALPSLGPVARDEMYTFVPALVLGGAEELQHVKRVKMREQLLILSQAHRTMGG
jgi:hypothetical protein